MQFEEQDVPGLVEVEGRIQAQVEVEKQKVLDYRLTCVKMLRMRWEEVERDVVDMESQRKHERQRGPRAKIMFSFNLGIHQAVRLRVQAQCVHHTGFVVYHRHRLRSPRLRPRLCSRPIQPP